MRFTNPPFIVSIMTKPMFLLLIFCCVWTMTMCFGMCFAWRSLIVLKTAHVVLGRRRIDVTALMHKIPHNLRRKSPVLQRLLNLKCNELQDAVRNAEPSLGKEPMCYLDITYICPTWGRAFEKTYRHVYEFETTSSRIQYPPVYKESPRTHAIKTATLIFRNSVCTTTLSVKNRLLPLGGQMGDFHIKNSDSQLRKRVLEVVLAPDISSLAHGENQLSSSSNESLKSMPTNQKMSVYFVFENPDRRPKMTRLDY